MILKGDIFTAVELSEIGTYMNIALEEAKTCGEVGK